MLDFFLFVSFFPHLIAGPVLRADQLLPQIRVNRPASAAQILVGIELCLIGLFQKVVVADNLALLVDDCFARPAAYAGAALLVAAFGFVGQIYCDFAGYSTMARGLASLLGYALPENFAYPLLASNPVELRRRWHITMGNWFRDYVYRPAGRRPRRSRPHRLQHPGDVESVRPVARSELDVPALGPLSRHHPRRLPPGQAAGDCCPRRAGGRR